MEERASISVKDELISLQRRAFFLHLKKWRLRGGEDTLAGGRAELGRPHPAESTVGGAGMSNNGKNRQSYETTGLDC